MSKNKNRSKESYNEPGDRGMFYDSKKCFLCGKLIWGSSPQSHKLAKKDCYFKMKAHKEECQKKQGKQLNLSIPGREGKQSQTIKKVSLRGE
ncbi:unnamed protein product, partial [marine sediment metagenome]